MSTILTSEVTKEVQGRQVSNFLCK